MFLFCFVVVVVVVVVVVGLFVCLLACFFIINSVPFNF